MSLPRLTHHPSLTICPNTLLAAGMLLSLVFVKMLGSISVVAFLACGLLMVLRRPTTLVAEMRAYIWLYSIPVWCLLTVLWSTHPGISLRYALQLGITFAVAITLASRLPPRIFVKLIFAAEAGAALASVVIGQVRSDGAWIGIFGSKNAFAAAMAVLVIVAFALVLGRSTPRSWRAAGLAGLAGGVPLLLKAQSAGALITTGMAIAAGLVIVLLNRMSPMQRMIAGGMSVCMALVAALLLLMFNDVIMAAFLEHTGKDMTLTGRTDLWRAALDEISRNPLFGQGYQAVWVVGNPVAEEMWAQFGIPSKSGFHFHNTYLSNAVEIGIIGAALQAAAILTATWMTLRWAIRSPRAESLFLALFMLRLLTLSMVEVLVFFQFNLTTMITICAIIYGLRSRKTSQRLNTDAVFVRSALQRSNVNEAGAQ